MNLNNIAAILLLGIFSCGSNGQDNTSSFKTIQRQTKLTSEEIKLLDSADVHYQLRGFCYAYSSPKYAIASNGEAHSDNIARPVDKSIPRNGLYLSINEKEIVKIDSNYLGFKLYLVNTSGGKVTLKAQDSRLYIIAEALNEQNEWVSIYYLPSSWCGNSYHKVTLGRNEYWSFDVPIFKGNFKTKLRYSLMEDNKVKLSSNEIIAHLNKEQFDPAKKQGHSPSGIMDPYDN